MPHQKDKTFKKNLLITSPFWKSKLELLCNPSAIRMAEDLCPDGPLGIGNGDDSFWKGFKHNHGNKDSNIDFLLRIKNQHPEKIILVQIGEFYETWAIDSVFLVEYCGLNRMGRGGPRAGTPLVNVQAILDDLTNAGFSVVVCEQTDDLSKRGRKTRFIAEIVSPSSPIYTHGLAMDRKRGGTQFPDYPPEFGLVSDKRGITVVEVNPDLQTVLIAESLTPEAAQARLSRYGGRLSRIFYHENVDKQFMDACHLKYENSIKVSGYLPKDFPRRVEELIKRDLSLDAKTDFTSIHPTEKKKEIHPRPIYLETAKQIGLVPERGVPNLMKHMLPQSSPLLCQNMLRNFLLNPPPKSVADALRTTLQTLLSTEISFPEFPVSNPARYVKTLQRGEASPEILRDLCKIAESFLNCCANDFASTVPQVLSVVAHTLSMQASEASLSKSSNFILDTLLPILPDREDTAHTPKSDMISKHLFIGIEETFRGRVARTATPGILKLYQSVEKAAAIYEKKLNTHFIPLVEKLLQQTNQKKKEKLALSYDIHNKTIWLRGNITQETIAAHKLFHPYDRYGKQIKDRWTSEAVEKALDQYKKNTEKTRLKIASLLNDISKILLPHSLPIVHLATFSNLLQTVALHIKECAPKAWTIHFDNSSKSSNRLEIEGFFPYWMRPPQAIKNTLHLNKAALLTGHNMSGKSTLIRSSAVATLLASSGFLFPADRISIPEIIDGWYVRTGTQDDPEAGLSAFAVEMNDLKTALRDASEKCFILIDELGKGTESKSGHAIAGSVLEYLQQHNIRSIFATHWHELFSNCEVAIHSIQKIYMESNGEQPTYQVQSGTCLSSFAFETALQLGLHKKIIDRAKQIAQGYQIHRASQETVFEEPLMVAEKASPFNTHSLAKAQKALSELANIPLKAIRHVSAKSSPALADVNSSILYILRTTHGFYYIGETDDIHSRLKSHRKEKAKKGCELIYAIIPEGKSAARRLENALIIQLQSLGFPMLSNEGLKNKHFGQTTY